MAPVAVIWSAILLLAFQEVASFSVATVSTIWRPRYSPGFELWERSIQSGSSTLVPTFVTPEAIRLCSCWWFLGLISTDLYKDCAPTFGPMSALDQCLCCCSQVMSVFHLRDFINLKIQKSLLLRYFRENTHYSVSHVVLFSWLFILLDEWSMKRCLSHRCSNDDHSRKSTQYRAHPYTPGILSMLLFS